MHDITQKRIQAGMNQKELAQAAGVSENTVSDLENGKRRARRSTLERVYEAIERKRAERDCAAQTKMQRQTSADSHCLTYGDLLRRKLISDEDLISAGKVRCHQNPKTCAGNCHECKRAFLHTACDKSKPRHE